MEIAPQQLDFRGLLFPGRTVLYVSEVAERLDVTEQHVINLIESGALGAINVGGAGRNFWRVPAMEFEKFVKARASK